MDKIFKITYQSSGSKKINAYIMKPSRDYPVLKKQIEMCLFEERQQPRYEIRVFWIDDDQDEIEIISQCDYDVFICKRWERLHLQIAAIGVDTEMTAASAKNTTTSVTDESKVPPAAAGSYEFAVHDRVECDGCLMAPIMGFRYKCIQCPNFDLCQNCEAKHVHSEHMMVRMPTNTCPNVIATYLSGKSSGRRHGKRSKSDGCPFVIKNGISVVIDDEPECAEVASGEQTTASPAAGCKERHHGRKHRKHHHRNILSNFYEIMHDLAEGGGSVAEAGTGETTTSSTTTTQGPSTTTTTHSTGFENIDSNVNATAAAAHIAAQKAHETAVKAAEIAAKVAHETAIQAAKNMTATNAAPSPTAAGQQENDKTQNKGDAATTTQSTTSPGLPSPALETIAQFLDPQYMKTGIQILNNFSDMFAKMLDPMDGAEGGVAPSCPFAANLRNNSTTSTKSSVSSNLNSMESDKKSEEPSEKSMEQQEMASESKKNDSEVLSHVEIDDVDTESESGDSLSETFIRLDLPKEPNTNNSNTADATSTHTATATPPQSLNKAIVMDFAQLSADLKAHIAEEAAQNVAIVAPTEIAKTATEQLLTKEISNGTPKESTTSTIASSPPQNLVEMRAIPVYHSDQRINNSVIAMMAMGFSNDGAWLTQLLESVNGNIAEALDIMSVAQRTGR